jgi:hypothetical protein
MQRKFFTSRPTGMDQDLPALALALANSILIGWGGNGVTIEGLPGSFIFWPNTTAAKESDAFSFFSPPF